MPPSGSGTSWRIPTLADDPAHPLYPPALAAIATVAAANAAPLAPTAPSRRQPNDHLAPCPGCGRHVPADMLLDVRGFASALRAACGWANVDLVCDGCRETAHRTGELSHAAMLTALGAPPDLVAVAHAHDAELSKVCLHRPSASG